MYTLCSIDFRMQTTIKKYVALLLYALIAHRSSPQVTTSSDDNDSNKENRYLPPVVCGSYMDIVATDIEDHFRYNPYYVRLARCHGANSLANPRNKLCVPTKDGVDTNRIHVFNIAEAVRLFQRKIDNCQSPCPTIWFVL